ncbi:MAG: branched-chain amino acid aminotransferase [Acidobacteria bacterium]|nr:branched-chain amino acid aminotransferase [Acidobacteriota bacterium]
MKAFYNGALIPKPDLNVHCDTVAFKYGAMVFEGIRAYWNAERRQLYVFRLDDHARRLEDSVRVMRMETSLTAGDFSRAVVAALEGNEIREGAHIRQMVWVDGPGEMFVTGPVSQAVIVTPKAGWFAGAGVNAAISSWQRISDVSMPPRVKCAANYQNGRLALMQARLDGYDSAILLNAAGKIAEEARGCIFMARKGRVSTPRVTDGILESITRETLIRLFGELHAIEVAEREIDRTELYLAEEIFVCGSGLEVTPILSIDRHSISGGRPGPLTQAIRDSYLKAARGELERYADWLTPVYRVATPPAPQPTGASAA